MEVHRVSIQVNQGLMCVVTRDQTTTRNGNCCMKCQLVFMNERWRCGMLQVTIVHVTSFTGCMSYFDHDLDLLPFHVEMML